MIFDDENGDFPILANLYFTVETEDLGSAQNVGTVSANPSAGVASIKVYLTSSGPGDALASSSSAEHPVVTLNPL